MTTTEFIKEYWKYYLVLERDILKVEPYVSFHPQNYNCFSNEFIKLYQAICSEIDVICKEYCKYIMKKTTAKGECEQINQYATYILTQHHEIVEQSIGVSAQVDFELIPWKEWSFNSSPSWWKIYNNIKHGRLDINKNGDGKYNYQYANLYNVLNALAALYVLEQYFYTDLTVEEAPLGKIPNDMITPRSELFGYCKVNKKLLTLTDIGSSI